jgi:hypothetical protein
MYMPPTHKSNTKSKAEVRLQCKGSINFSSLYFEGLKHGEALVGSGEPPQTKELKNKKPNPFFESRADGYLFIVSNDFQTIEILVVPNHRNLVRGYATQLADGELNEVLQTIRNTATPIFNG